MFIGADEDALVGVLLGILLLVFCSAAIAQPVLTPQPRRVTGTAAPAALALAPEAHELAVFVFVEA